MPQPPPFVQPLRVLGVLLALRRGALPRRLREPLLGARVGDAAAGVCEHARHAAVQLRLRVRLRLRLRLRVRVRIALR